MASRSPLPAGLFLCLAITTLLPAQGSFVNFEDPQTRPIALCTLGSSATAQRLLLICNTPDNSVEIYRATSPFDFLARVPVGLSPVTVRWNSDSQRFYTCNFLGDSVTAVRLSPGLSAGTVGYSIERTVFVGDEPSDIAFFTNDTCFVSLSSRSGIAHLRTADLSVISPLVVLKAPSPLQPGVEWAAKAPRAMAVLPDQRFYALNHRGGQVTYDLDLFVSDPNNPPAGQNTNLHLLGGMGTTNFNFAIDSRGRRMFVVGTRAQNLVNGVTAVAAQVTGFVQSWLSVVELVPGVPGAAPVLAPQQATGPGPKALWQSINLNRDYASTGLVALPASAALAQPTDVALLEDETGEVVRIVLTAFGSDKVAVLSPDANQPSGYRVQQTRMPLVNQNADYGATGPRGLALDPAGVDPTSTARRGLVFVHNRLDNSFAVINPWTLRILQQRALRNDPTPATIRKGRPFLYSAHLTSGSQTVACASCHIDGDNDGLVWNLGSPNVGPPIQSWLHDGNGQTIATMPDFPSAKGFMATQSLRGLVNSHLEPFEMQFVTTNAPYHWRGDKRTFQDFNEAFVNLQGMPNMGAPADPKGLSADDMNAYTGFINTIPQPPNPEQWKDRTLKGALGDPNTVLDPGGNLVGSGGLLGLKLYHIDSVVGARSCVHCHMLPDGSSNTLTLTELVDGFLPGIPVQVQPFETAATRHIFGREMVRAPGFDPSDNSVFVQSGTFGLLHEGGLVFGAASRSINDFVHRVFTGALPGAPGQQFTAAQAITELMRQFDTGTAPLIGFAYTVDPLNPVFNNAALNLLEGQTGEANTGLAVYTRSNGTERGFWFDPVAGRYREEGGNLSLSRAQLLALAQGNGNAVILQATPTGSERRVAALSGTAARLTGPAPTNLRLLPMAPNTFWQPVSRFTANWDPNHPTQPFTWGGPGPEPQSLRSIRTLQQSLLGTGFGVPALRHEPPRRLRVTGDDIRPGARLALAMATQSPGAWPGQLVWFDLAPTRYTSNGQTVWETAEELDPMQTMAWLHGGYWSPGVAEVLQGVIPPSQPLDPATWNRFAVAVQNEDGTFGLAPSWQSLTITDAR